jgi:DNA-binding CsgD family transcriptional regulator
MATQITDDPWSLTEKEKQTLRLIVRGHDAKSIARALDLSVHTINERLRDARRKMAVSSSREAARLLLAAEGGDAPLVTGPENLGDNAIGDDLPAQTTDQVGAPIPGAERNRSLILTGVLMTLALGLLALTTLPFTTTAPKNASPAPTEVAIQGAESDAVNPEVVNAARAFLTMIEQKRWEDSYAATGTAFRKLNTLAVWSQVSEDVHARYGATVSRTLISQQNLPAPPAGYEVVKFRTVYANKAQAVETVTLDREDGKWVVVGVTVG